MSTLAATSLESPAFDLREFVARLVKKGVPDEQAQEHAQVVREAVTQYVTATLQTTIKAEMKILEDRIVVVTAEAKREAAQAATKGDVRELRTEVKGDIALVDAKIDGLQKELDIKIEILRKELDIKVEVLRKEIAIARRDTIIWLGGILGSLSLAIGGLLLHILSKLPL